MKRRKYATTIFAVVGTIVVVVILFISYTGRVSDSLENQVITSLEVINDNQEALKRETGKYSIVSDQIKNDLRALEKFNIQVFTQKSELPSSVLSYIAERDIPSFGEESYSILVVATYSNKKHLFVVANGKKPEKLDSPIE